MTNRDYNKTTWIIAGCWWAFMLLVVGPVSQSFNHPFLFAGGLALIFGIRLIRKRAVLARSAKSQNANEMRPNLAGDQVLQSESDPKPKKSKLKRFLLQFGLFVLIIFTVPFAMHLSGVGLSGQVVVLIGSFLWFVGYCLRLLFEK